MQKRIWSSYDEVGDVMKFYYLPALTAELESAFEM